jgi:hypothetical protein
MKRTVSLGLAVAVLLTALVVGSTAIAGRSTAATPKVVVTIACMWGQLPYDAVTYEDYSAGAPPLPTPGADCARAISEIMTNGGFEKVIGTTSNGGEYANYTFVK